MDIKNIFQTDKNKVIRFIGNKLIVRIPKRYEIYGCLKIQQEVHTLGIFELIINDKIEKGFFLPAIAIMIPSDIQMVNIENETYYELTFEKNDVFMKSSYVVQNQALSYVIFKEFISVGKLPKFINYQNAPLMFDTLQKITGAKLTSNSVIYEIIFAYLYRNKKDIMKPYRLTNMKEEPVFIPAKDVAHSAISATGRIVGSYLNDCITSVIVNEAENNSEIEDILRQ